MKTFSLFDSFLVDGFYVTQNYLDRPAYYKQFNLLGHEGVDFGHKNKKIVVRSPLSGTAFVGYSSSYGNYTVIEDYKQGCAIYICHTLKPLVESGEEVKAGDEIAEMDTTGNSSGEHVHFNFVILNAQGSNKYHEKSKNWGFLDPQYPRDTSKPVTFAGVESYQVLWTSELTQQPSPGNGNTMPETLTVNKADWDRLMKASQLGDRLLRGFGESGNIADKSEMYIDEQIAKRSNVALDKRFSEGFEEGKKHVTQQTPETVIPVIAGYEDNGLVLETTIDFGHKQNQKVSINYKKKQ